jgi:hypothetical protein
VVAVRRARWRLLRVVGASLPLSRMAAGPDLGPGGPAAAFGLPWRREELQPARARGRMAAAPRCGDGPGSGVAPLQTHRRRGTLVRQRRRWRSVVRCS